MTVSPLYIALAAFSLTISLFIIKFMRKPQTEHAFVEIEPTTQPKKNLPALITIYLLPKKQINGNELLRFLLDHQLQYHHQQEVFHLSHHGATLFYVATLSSPGTFNLDTMASDRFEGLSFFTQPQSSKTPLEDFDALCHILFEAKDTFEGILQDEKKQEISLDDLRQLRSQLSQDDEALD